MNANRMEKLGGLFLALFFAGIASQRASAGDGKRCTMTAQAAYSASKTEARSDYWIAVGNCYNIEDDLERKECLAEAREEFAEAKAECREQRDARRDICEILGEGTYEPEIDPADFVDFEAVIDGTEILSPNPYFRLIPGTTREYIVLDSEDEIIERVLVEVLEETREILGVNCIVVRDRVWEVEDDEETLVEDTSDWLAQHRVDGDVWYFGESSKDFEDGVLVSVEGSFEAGKDSAQPGIWVLADPAPGDFYRQEYALGEAEDVAEVISVGEETVTVPAGEYSAGVLKTKDSSPLEPDVFEFKFYAPGVGLVMEIDPESGDQLVLVEMVDP